MSGAGGTQGTPASRQKELRCPGVAAGIMAGLKTATGDAIDASWELRVTVDGAETKDRAEAANVTLRVTGDLHIGGLMLRVAEKIGERFFFFFFFRPKKSMTFRSP